MPTTKPSTLVTVIAWLGIVSGCLATLGGIWMLTVTPSARAIGTLVGGAFTLAAGIGLRRRRNWARLGFIAVAALAILRVWFNVLSVPDLGDAEDFRFAFIAVAVVITLLNGLIIRLLTSRRIREEFDADG